MSKLRPEPRLRPSRSAAASNSADAEGGATAAASDPDNGISIGLSTRDQRDCLMEIRRFGAGFRRPEALPGTRGVEVGPIHAGERGHIAELALSPNGAIAPHSNPNLTYFLVIEGGGWVAVGGERARVSAGDAVLWPPDVDHAAWTEQTPMRAIVVEFEEPVASAATAPVVALGDGALADPPAAAPIAHESSEREPW
jgi:quercetin dioxygenase-like cupin family protein